MERKKTFNVLFWLRKSRTNESLSPLFCRVTIMGQRYEIPTNCHISPASWSAVAQKSLGKTAVDKETNRRTGTTKIGKYVLNHSFMMPGLVSTVVAIALGLLFIQIF